MEKYIPYAKLSKKEKRRADQRKRGSWGTFSPVTRKPDNFRAYNRNKTRNWRREDHGTNGFGSFLFPRFEGCACGRRA